QTHFILLDTHPKTDHVITVGRKDTFSTTAQSKDQTSIKDTRDYDFKEKCNEISVFGRLKTCSNFWKNNLHVSNFIQKIIDEGYFITFKSVPPAFFAKNNKSSLDNSNFVQDAIKSLLSKGCISEVSDIPKCCNPLTVAERNSKLRLVLDLRHVNQFVDNQKFKYEDLKTFAELFDQDDFFITFDLTSGYHHVDIHPEHKKYLGFHWLFPDGQTKYFIFNVLPFGLSSACYIFTKNMRPFIKKWRSEGIKKYNFYRRWYLWGEEVFAVR
uniref:Reverse transcriptase domain-containing protein n=1 Tax=Clytia hemisphaerica TaxID=252671 RepID=A0A7M5VC30_9CNID